MSKVILFGTGGWAQYLHYSLTRESGHEVVGFTMDAEDLQERTLFGLPVVDFAEVTTRFPPSACRMLVALGDQQLNQLRESKYLQAKAMGYQLISFVSPRAQTFPDLEIGDNCLVLEDTVIHPGVKIGNNVTVGASTIVGFNSVVEAHAFLAPGAVILGEVTIGTRSLVGPNAAIGQGVRLGRDCRIGPGVSLAQDAQDGSAYPAPVADLMPQTSEELIPFMSWS